MSQPERVELTAEERHLLALGLREWGGPSHPTDELARIIGFGDVSTLLSDGKRIARAIEDGAPLTSSDWARALVATEIAFASDFYGSGVEWPITTGRDDEETIRRLRSVQRKLVSVVGPARGQPRPWPTG